MNKTLEGKPGDYLLRDEVGPKPEWKGKTYMGLPYVTSELQLQKYHESEKEWLNNRAEARAAAIRLTDIPDEWKQLVGVEGGIKEGTYEIEDSLRFLGEAQLPPKKIIILKPKEASGSVEDELMNLICECVNLHPYKPYKYLREQISEKFIITRRNTDSGKDK